MSRIKRLFFMVNIHGLKIDADLSNRDDHNDCKQKDDDVVCNAACNLVAISHFYEPFVNISIILTLKLLLSNLKIE